MPDRRAGRIQTILRAIEADVKRRSESGRIDRGVRQGRIQACPSAGAFAEAPFDQFGQGLDRRFGVGTAGSQSECRTVSGPQRQQVQDAFAVNHLVSLHNFDLTRERAGQLHEQMRRASMKSLRIYDGYGRVAMASKEEARG